MIPRKPVKVGITGGMGSGKSTVCRMFAMLGIPVYDTDAKARELMDSEPELTAAIKKRFGDEAYKDGELDRERMAAKVFGDPEALGALNGLVHPAVRRDFAHWADEQNAPYVLLESAIVFDTGLDKHLDRVITVSAPEVLRVRRAMQRDGADESKIRARIASQMTDAERERRADYVIRNDEKSLVWEQVLEIDGELKVES